MHFSQNKDLTCVSVVCWGLLSTARSGMASGSLVSQLPSSGLCWERSLETIILPLGGPGTLIIKAWHSTMICCPDFSGSRNSAPPMPEAMVEGWGPPQASHSPKEHASCRAPMTGLCRCYKIPACLSQPGTTLEELAMGLRTVHLTPLCPLLPLLTCSFCKQPLSFPHADLRICFPWNSASSFIWLVF